MNFSVFVLYNITLKLVTVIGTFEIFVCICYLKHLKEAQKKVDLVNPGKHQFFCSSNFISQFYFLMKSNNALILINANSLFNIIIRIILKV